MATTPTHGGFPLLAEATPLVGTHPARAGMLLQTALGRLWRDDACGGVASTCAALGAEAAQLEALCRCAGVP